MVISRWVIILCCLGGAAPAWASEGHDVYKQTCAGCHSAGVTGAPRLGNNADWKNRLLAGRSALLHSVLNGNGAMPPKGGDASLTDAQAEAALDYILSTVDSQ